jgi:DNA-directed RNA polymerase specialized sigma24 family protein
MIKFKYGQTTMEEENLLHENIKNLIYNVMHKNCVRMEFEDVYHEIWKKIIKSKHTWDENNGTRVSTWIVVVANSVINTLRLSVNKYNSRYCLYGDLATNNEDESANDMADVVALNNEEDNSFTEDMEFKDNYKNFCKLLSENERKMLYVIVNGDGKISLRSISRETGIKYNDVGEMLNSIKAKFYQIFEERKTKDIHHASKKN